MVVGLCWCKKAEVGFLLVLESVCHVDGCPSSMTVAQRGLGSKLRARLWGHSQRYWCESSSGWVSCVILGNLCDLSGFHFQLRKVGVMVPTP